MSRRAALNQGDLFDASRVFVVPREPEPTAGSLAWDAQLRGALNLALKQSPHSREIVAARMSELLGEEVTKTRLDAWTAQSHSGHRFPLSHLPAFETACETHAITRLLVEKRGCRLLIGEEAIDAEYGRVERQIGELKSRLKSLQTMSRRGSRR